MRYRRVDVGPCPRSHRLQLGPRPPHTCYVLRPAGKAEGPGGMWGPAVITYQPFSNTWVACPTSATGPRWRGTAWTRDSHANTVSVSPLQVPGFQAFFSFFFCNTSCCVCIHLPHCQCWTQRLAPCRCSVIEEGMKGQCHSSEKPQPGGSEGRRQSHPHPSCSRDYHPP